MKPFLKIAFLITAFSAFVPSLFAISYDLPEIQNKWLEWTNTERSKYGLPDYQISEALNITASSWSEYSKSRGYIDHKRPGQKLYYDFNKIGGWFNSKGVSFQKVSKTTFSESIGWNVYSCKKDDCTERLLSAVKTTFEMYMREKGKKYRPHYNALINKDFTVVGIGLSVDEKKHKYYITIHYGTKVLVKK
ncbi:MAG: CAP domain-containing protein [Candidatus Gracilibacteria bacterium]|nr:CAP domain-containing protein [Candidatus Gracilibacteria bacterium]